MRDDFTAKTKEILAKRVGYICSNPDCGKPTVGPNEDVEKATSIGIAAHITAASIGGPRFDDKIDPSERIHITNGIWLCANCSILIDRDEKRYPPAMLKDWKSIAENNMLEAIRGNRKAKKERPFLEADLTWDYKSRRPDGYSRKNLEVFEQPIPAGTDLYQHWTLKWSMKFLIHNNSETIAYNVQINEISKPNFDYLDKLPKINNIQPFQSIEVDAIYTRYFHGTSAEADQALPNFPPDLEDKVLEICYKDVDRDEHKTIVTLKSNDIINQRG